MPKRLDDLKTRVKEYARSLRVRVLAVLVAVAIASSLWAVLRTGDLEGLALNFGTEMAGAVATYVLLEVFLGSRERREAKKADLIMQLGSQVKDMMAIAAAEELRRYGWLSDGSLQGVHLVYANLQGANLSGADLRNAKLWGSKLQEVTLAHANLQGANLWGAILQGAWMTQVDLRGADLGVAVLAGANLTKADLRKADLGATILQGANLSRAKMNGAKNWDRTAFDEHTTLPDDEESIRTLSVCTAVFSFHHNSRFCKPRPHLWT